MNRFNDIPHFPEVKFCTILLGFRNVHVHLIFPSRNPHVHLIFRHFHSTVILQKIYNSIAHDDIQSHKTNPFSPQ